MIFSIVRVNSARNPPPMTRIRVGMGAWLVAVRFYQDNTGSTDTSGRYALVEVIRQERCCG